MKETYPRPRPKRPQDGASADGIIEGRNAVAEALRAGTPIDKVFLCLLYTSPSPRDTR